MGNINPTETHSLPIVIKVQPLLLSPDSSPLQETEGNHHRTMSTKAAQILGHPPGVNFRPDDDELVEFFLLPRLRGEPSWFPGVVVIDDDSAANTLPWNLLKRHGLVDDGNAYFFVHTNNEVARQDRYCPGDGTWVSQRQESGSSCICGETIKWRRTNLNLQMGRGKKGSMGWVMHEYTLTEPPCPFLKICHVTFTGHGKWRKRVPDDESDCQATGEPASKRPRVAVTAAAVDTSVPAIFQQEHSLPFPIDQGISAMTHQQQMVMMPMPDDKNDCQAANSSSATCAYGSTMTTADQDSGAAHAYAGEESAQDTDEETLEWFRLDGKDLLADAEPTAEQQYGLDQQDQLFWRSIGVDTENIVF